MQLEMYGIFKIFTNQTGKRDFILNLIVTMDFTLMDTNFPTVDV